MTPRRTNGTSLLEVLLVVAVSAVLVTGAAAHFRSLRQVGDTTRARREALQNARVALDRMARAVRAALEIKDVKSPNAGNELIQLGMPADDCKFELKEGDLLYDGADDGALATGVTLFRIAGFDAQGNVVPNGEPQLMRRVALTVAVGIAGTSDSVQYTTSVRLRTEPIAGENHAATYYASHHTQTAGQIADADEAFDKADGSFAQCRDEDGGRFGGFDPGDDAGAIGYISAGFRLYHLSSSLRVIIAKEGVVLVDETFLDIDLPPWANRWGWMWFDLTHLQASWDQDDVRKLSIEVSDPGPGRTSVDLDCFALKVIYGRPCIRMLWADREGGSQWPKEWINADQALREPDGLTAEGRDHDTYDMQGYRATVPTPDSNPEITAVELCIHGSVAAAVALGAVEVRVALADGPETEGTIHALFPRHLNQFVGLANQGNMLIDITGYDDWTWHKLDEREIRLHVDTGGGRDLHVDAVGWRIIYPAETSSGISGWSE